MIGFALTQEQLATLLKMVYVANTVANSPHEGTIARNDFDEMEQYIFSRAKDVFPMAVYQHKTGEENHHHPSMIFENDPDVNSLMDQYEEYAARYVLAEKFAEKDIEIEFGIHAKDKMSAEQFEALVEERSQDYVEILQKHGMKAVIIDPKYR